MDCQNNIVTKFYADCSVQIDDKNKRRRYYFDSIENIDYEAQSVTLSGNSSRVAVNYENIQIPNVDSFDDFVAWIQDLLKSKDPFTKLCSIEGSLADVIARLDQIILNTNDNATETTLAAISATLTGISTQISSLATEATLVDVETLLTTITGQLTTALTSLSQIATNTANLEARLDTIIGILQGNVVADLVGAIVSGSTDTNVKSVSVLVIGTGASINGEAVPNGYSASWSNEHGGLVTNAIPYVVPSAADPVSGLQKIIITYNR